MKYSIKDFFSKCDQIQKTVHLVTFDEEILNGKFLFFTVFNENNAEIPHIIYYCDLIYDLWNILSVITDMLSLPSITGVL